MDNPQELKCTIANVNTSCVNVTASWSPPINAEIAALAFYRITVTLFDASKNLIATKSATLIATDSRQNASYTVVLPSEGTYSASIIAENKCGQMSEKIIIVCSACSNEFAKLHLYIFMYFVYKVVCTC